MAPFLGGSPGILGNFYYSSSRLHLGTFLQVFPGRRYICTAVNTPFSWFSTLQLIPCVGHPFLKETIMLSFLYTNFWHVWKPPNNSISSASMRNTAHWIAWLLKRKKPIAYDMPLDLLAFLNETYFLCKLFLPAPVISGRKKNLLREDQEDRRISRCNWISPSH